MSIETSKSPKDSSLYLLQSKAQSLEQTVEIKTRTYLFKKYANCFIGSEAVKAIQKLKFANNEADAIAFGNRLLDAKLIEHVKSEHIFKNEYLFYRFTETYHNSKIEPFQLQTPNSANGQRTSFYLIESEMDKCTFSQNPITEIKAHDSITKQEYGIKWTRAPKTCIILKKYKDAEISKDLLEMANWLIKEKQMTVYVSPEVHKEEFKQFKAFDLAQMGCTVDFMIVLGGDGTLLHLASLFQGSMSIPPVISFARGSLGFLTAFDYSEFKQILTRFLTPNQAHWVNIRMRLKAKVFRKTKQAVAAAKTLCNPADAAHGSPPQKHTNGVQPEEEEKKQSCSSSIYNVENDLDGIYECVYDKHALNEVLIERGGDISAMIMLQLHVNRKLVTYVQADGLIISTPTGSTAYSVSAGGSLIAPNVPCIGLTPICPHTLSFRPVVVSDSSIIHVTIPERARNMPKVTMDGKFPFSLQQTDIVQIQASRYPLCTFKSFAFQHEWWSGLVDKFNWNVRELQQ